MGMCDFMLAVYYLSDFIRIYLHMYWIKVDLMKLLKLKIKPIVLQVI